MSKILIEGNKVIINGHASDLETCNTLTNLCDELSKSEKFRTVKYESGYGEFESVSECGEKKFRPSPIVNIYSNDGNTLLLTLQADQLVITSTGIKLYDAADTNAYTYSGSKVFAGVSTSANSVMAKYEPGTTVDIYSMGVDRFDVYIVENIILQDHYSTLTALFSDIATVIREKTGDTASIVADDFPDVIRKMLQAAPPPPYLTFKSPSSFTLKVNDTTKHWDGTLEYSTDTSTWTTWDGTTTLSSDTSRSDNVLYLRGTGNTMITGNKSNYRWVLTGSDIKCIGNIENLLDYATVESGAHPTMANYCYYHMFQDCTSLTKAPALPATTLASSCYQNMFINCTSLIQAPALPATTLSSFCYSFMFSGCTSLPQAPALPATTLASSCYYGMFYGCTALTKAPALPATTLANSCYKSLFYNCKSLTQAPALPATTLADYCYQEMFYNCTNLIQAPALPATTLASYCYKGMFTNCISLIQAPALPATTLADHCYQEMFYNCSSLTQAPALPATTLASYCYLNMFVGCTGFTQAPDLPVTTLASHCYYGMFQNCKSLTQAPALPATTLADYCYDSMFRNCSSLTKAPALPATTLAGHCYSSMFYGCTALTQAPALPATTLADYCYQEMFYNCTNLIQAPALPATTLSYYCYSYMFRNCSSLIQAPALPATKLAEWCYSNMFYGCTKIKLSSNSTGEYTVAYRIPSSGTGTTDYNALINMFTSTGGTFTGTPEINTTYYLSNTNTVISPPISFTIDETSYLSEDGMTWEQWINSKYNTIGLTYAISPGGNKVVATTNDFYGLTQGLGSILLEDSSPSISHGHWDTIDKILVEEQVIANEQYGLYKALSGPSGPPPIEPIEPIE